MQAMEPRSSRTQRTGMSTHLFLFGAAHLTFIEKIRVEKRARRAGPGAAEVGRRVVLRSGRLPTHVASVAPGTVADRAMHPDRHYGSALPVRSLCTARTGVHPYVRDDTRMWRPTFCVSALEGM